MTDDLFALLVAHALADWSAISYALANEDKLPVPLSPEALTGFAERQLASLEPGEPAFDEIAALALECPHSRDDMQRTVSMVCRQTGQSDDDIAARKWRVVELEWILENLNNDPVYALIQLSTFWTKWGWPSDAPASMKAGGIAEGADYGSDSHLKSVLQEHKDWVMAELRRLH